MTPSDNMTVPGQPEQLSNHPVVEYLTAGEVAEWLHVSEKTVYRWAKADPTLPMLKLGGTVRFPRERLERWLRDREQGQPRVRRRVVSPRKATPPQEAVGA